MKIHHLVIQTSGFRIEPLFFKPLIETSPEHPQAPSVQPPPNPLPESRRGLD